ncbi:ABC transporter ATP-binding protein [Corynebacterium macginleyi]|uniref:ABC transporter ATP-binding protein n=1 Tax=Corynebacterium macginleyi TaxID=38290 RepID=A0ABS1Y5F9_9CORY|nr:ABC transporter ATP-binding protein [Corynebacterium macginleyi]MBK4151539.1 ATP-binding cassette domain-containing protein [Corynebacterium macginleyi]MBK4167211.1 ATP-binding cassette domain-containing protein [Corynebacterium macginleyi]MBM0243627.1 ABC transporter ATP-binding protein [Corynebacterium macginleyi]QRJ60831.1 ABC transporter ATP-binding protein [Corynebacterium macginleyi]QRP22158.1 ABC transporter ATP-binding protein [Corynebacterium macginleyi]
MLTLTRLSKRYGSFTAVDNLSFEVPDGQVTGFLGPNGSGKSTTMRMCVGLENPTSGTATFDGTPFRELSDPASMVGTLLDATWFHPGRSARAHLGYMAALQGVSMNHVDDTLERVGLEKVAKKRVGSYSLGMKQRLGLACALIGQPKHLLLDEPVNGLDPEGVHWMRDRIRDYAAGGSSVLVSSHLLSEMQLAADRLVVIGKGTLVGEGTVEEFVTASGAATVEVVVDQPEKLVRLLHDMQAATSFDGQVLRITGLDSDTVGQLCFDHRIRISGLQVKHPSLEDAFLGITADHVDYRSV